MEDQKSALKLEVSRYATRPLKQILVNIPIRTEEEKGVYEDLIFLMVRIPILFRIESIMEKSNFKTRLLEP